MMLPIPVLLVSYFFPPTNTAGVYRIMGFTKYLGSSGIRPILLTALPVPSRERVDPALATKVSGDLIICRTRTWCFPKTTKNGIWGKILNVAADQFDRFLPVDPYLLFGIAASRSARHLILRYRCKAVVTSSPPHSIHLIGFVQKRYFGMPWIADFRDLVIAKPRSFSDRLERLVVENADVTIANTPTNRSILASRYPSCKDRIIVIPNGFDPDDRDLLPILKKQGDNPARKLLIVYTGEIYPGMGEALWGGLRILKEMDPSISERLEIRIAGILSESDLRQIENQGLSDIVKYVGFLPVAECSALLAKSDVALFLLPQSGVSHWVPSKLYNYLGARKFVVAIVPVGDASRIIEEVNAGICVRPIPQKIAEAFMELVELKDRGDIESAYNIDALQKYSRIFQVKQLAEAIRNISSKDK